MNNHCLAPWVHTFVSPQSERRMCCASREPSQNFKQYIDAEGEESGDYNPMTLEEHWNSEHMKSVRTRMMAGETLPECQVCDKKLLNTDVYRSYFNNMFAHKRDEVLSKTDADGTFHGLPVSYDYRVSNICTFKCRMCGPMLSSAWEAEQRQHDPHFERNHPWASHNVKKKINAFQKEVVLEELWDAIKEDRIEEIYWVGGEPLDWKFHWEMLDYMIKNDTAKNVYLRYNSNLRSIYGPNDECLVDLLPHFRDWQICASIDGVYEYGEYIRTGFDYDNFKRVLARLVDIDPEKKKVKLDFTLTIPGMVGIFDFISEVQDGMGMRDGWKRPYTVLAKQMFAFSDDSLMSPLALPREVLDEWCDDVLRQSSMARIPQTMQPLVDLIQQLKVTPTFAESYPDSYIAGRWMGKAKIDELDRVRGGYTFEEILSNDEAILDWWKSI